ncbi:5-methylthioadenosine/S-adenosylhomocysteine deaminase n1 [Aspergillus steynii IBT 23096]|uniref:5-methylthioadenosine/S-adenosylhomocysteine deaminase n1 n=1 Tax=Aspergillus steynii IBT 23096 TaxID=1392250 RepID=A0A2I2FU88_9EURO|nr:5-methylthioadenosine/S-adenosylhomocysteine deaminase n1 [Aspergillus steynii IBT 23096]PLB44209.1 5-methylthioadenosine/S-adenosylhomocysteine deaminase n1 [Aspergillus steynii IBT 23096]
MSVPAALYTNGIIITVDEKRRVIRNGFIAVNENRITAIDPMSKLDKVPVTPDTKIVDLQRGIVIPGLVNGHVHVIQSIMRGLCEDLNLHEWASCAIWPMEVNLQENDGYVAAKLAMAEMIKTGTTCFLEPMLPASAGFDGVCRAVKETGIRACLGKLVKGPRSDPSAGIPDARDAQASLMSIDSVLSAHREYHGSCNDRLHVWVATETPRGADEAGFAATGKAAKDHDIRLTMHLSESAKDYDMIQKSYSATPGKFTRNVHAAGPHVMLGHMVHLDSAVDMDILRADGTHIAHNPTSNAKLGDGIAPIPELLDHGVNVCLGSDGGPCNNQHDLFRDMHLAGIIHKARLQDAHVMPAELVIEMATINGAKALGLEKEIGSLEAGKKADFVVLNANGLGAAPFNEALLGEGGIHPATIIVHSCTGRDVEMVVLDGREVLKVKTRETIARLQQRSGVKAQPQKRNWSYV